MIARYRYSRLARTFGLLLLFVSGFMLLAIPAAALSVQAVTTQAGIASPTSTVTAALSPTFDPARLERPQVAEPPLQLEQGRLIYWSTCMACHGDTGQGLTDEWRESYGEDRNCWTSQCHASDYHPLGFELPRLVPALAGEAALARFVNAGQLYQYNRDNMPWWDPGYLTDAKARAVTAYLLKLNDRLPNEVAITAANEEFIPTQYKIKSPAHELPWKILLAGALLLAGTGVGLRSIHPQNRTRPGFILHLHPPTIPAEQARFRYTLGAGGLAVFLCLILLATGLLEMYYYIPSPEHAARSVQEITFLVPFGGLVRNLHFWSAQLLAVVATVHLLRVIFTGAYTAPRRFNYLLGLGLFLLVFLLDFTGYVLRWDEGIRWALIAGTNLLGTVPGIGEGLVRFVSGNLEPGPAMLIRFYAWHVFGLALLAGILLVWHLFRVRRDGGIALPRMRPETLGEEFPLPSTRIPRIELLRREVVAMLVTGGFLLLISTFVPAPIEPSMDASLVNLAESRAPWFFLWVQELLKFGDPFLWGIVVPLLVFGLLGILPYVFPRLRESEIGRWFPASGRAVRIVFILLAVTIVVLTILATQSIVLP